MAKKYLLILPCSKQKKQLNNVSALDLYDGPFYKITKKYFLSNVDILIISAKYGLIRSSEIISYYDQKMTIERARELSNNIRIKLNELFKRNHYDKIFINLGRTYMLVLEDSKWVLEGENVYCASGKIGERLHQLKNWLKEISSEDADLL
jgi:hypothetical protein